MSLRIRFVSTHLGHVRGGAEINDLTLGAEFSKMGHDVSYITIGNDSANLSNGVKTLGVDCPYAYDLSYSVPEPLGKIIRHLNEELFIHRIHQDTREPLSEADIVYATGRPVLSRLRKLTDSPFVYTVRGRVNPLYDRYLKRADGLVFWGGCDEEYEDKSILSIPNRTIDPGIDPDTFCPQELSDGDKPEYATNESTVLTFSGRLEPVKQIDNIIEAVSRLESEFDLTLVILGDGSQRSKLEELADSIVDETPIHFTGRVEHDSIPTHLNASDVFILASAMENHPIALKEAIACGTYSVAPAIGRIPQIVSEDTGYVYEDNTTKGLTAALQEILSNNRHKRRSRRERSVQFADWNDAADKIINLFKQLQ
ncbi:glycosyltransferase family 4 protein [Haloarcula sp. JP-Z28]|uniref:glycosyltransferase n=1 Tax=Haloarcula sp. JP-Z28 TaxID=2716715 RepID=UPI0014044D1F|nr:glycosyltransferase [Haloarcula sp. JP-Z28]NHN65596.1 glycosyltransferase family 4 protein [Haloarcula sp. JP-Z28]